MNRIVSKEHFSPHVVKLEVEAPLIARSRKAGHFVIVRVGEQGERIPLTIASADTLLFAPVEASAWRPCCLSWRPSIRLVTA